MKALRTLRHIATLLLFGLAAATASAAPAGTGDRDSARRVRKASQRPAAERTMKTQRKEVAAFADPTLPLAVFVERVRTEQAR